MPQIKVYPPTQLPDRGVSETQFKIWLEELEVYLSQEDKFHVFLEGGDYAQWDSQEDNPNRLSELKGEDLARDNRTGPSDAAKLKERIRDLRTVLSFVGKCVSQGHYEAVVRHSTSMQSIIKTLRCDYDIQQKGIHFLNILDVKYDSSKQTPIAFYNRYRTLISNNLSRRTDVIKYKNVTMGSDEKMSPMIEDLTLLNVIKEIDPRLPRFVKMHYTHKMSSTDRLMDFKTDIMNNISNFIQELDKDEQLASIRAEASPQLAWIRNQQRRQPSKQAEERKLKSQRKYCRLCHKCDMPKEIFTSHNIGDDKCTQLSAQDRQKLQMNHRLSNISLTNENDDVENDMEEDKYAEEFGYRSEDEASIQQVKNSIPNPLVTQNISRCNGSLGYIAPVPTQLLTVFLDEENKTPVHIDIDSGATLNYAREKEVLNLGFKIYPNGQLSTLGDGRTRLPSVGEIDLIFFRNKWKIRYRALVTRELQSAFIGGTVFLVDNYMEQDLNRKLIHIHNRKVTVQETNPISIMPIQPMLQTSCPESQSSPVLIETFQNLLQDELGQSGKDQHGGQTLHKCQKQVILPGQLYEVHTKGDENGILAVQPWEQNKNPFWPEPQLCTVREGRIQIENKTAEPIIMPNEVKYIKILSTSTPKANIDETFYTRKRPMFNKIKSDEDENISQVTFGAEVEPDVKDALKETHNKYKEVFNKDLTSGYNDFYGVHRCKLNWSSNERPVANKVRVPHYNHELQGLQQELMDDLTDQGVLIVPQEHDVMIQAVCPSFLQRKQRAKDKPQHMLTKDDVRLLINFGPVNDKIKPIPSHVTKTEDILIKLGRWKELIIFDLYNGYFQIKMSKDSIPWLGVQTPFGGLRAISRSGQGLLGQAEEFDEVLAKVLKEELKEGICAKIVDDIYVGGKNQKEAKINYIRILSKLKNANLKISPTKTHIFPTTVDVLGWVWKRGGFLSPSPHRQCALTNVKQEDIKKVKDMRSWVGLYKTLHIATPHITTILEPFEIATGGKDSKDKFEWNHQLEQQFRLAKNHVKTMKTLYLPSPEDQLVLVTDGSKMTPGIGHILYAVVDGKRLPVRFHTLKLRNKCKKWAPCEIEALALAAGINKEFDLLRESKLPIIICPDNKPVHDAVNLINSGKFSTNARMTTFLANINRIPVISQHISGKAKLNPIADLQSRAPSTCNTDVCTIHRFVEESIEGVIDPGAKNSSITNDPYTNRVAWKTAQMKNPACALAKTLLSTGKPAPRAVGKHTGQHYNEVRFICREAALSRDGLLVVHTKPDALSGNISRERIIIPRPFVPALLYHLHNHSDHHPTRNQQKISFQRRFHTMDLDKHLDNLYGSCYKCSITQKLPKELIQHESKQVVNGPHTHFHADVIKRASQLIFTLKDHFSSLQDATLIDSEKAEDLKAALILLSSTMRSPNLIQVTVDNAPGFSSLVKKEDKDLQLLKINLILTDEFNKNANAVIDKGCQELEEELLKLEPEGVKISQVILAKAILGLNQKMRRRGNISAYELHTARDITTGENLNLDDQKLRQNQLQAREDKNAKTRTSVKDVQVGDTVIALNKQDKHKAKDMFIVMAKEGNKVEVQKVLHPLVGGKGKIMSKVYKTDEKRLKTIHRQYLKEENTATHEDEIHQSDNESKKPIKIKIKWNPVNKDFFLNSSDSDEDDDNAISEENIINNAGVDENLNEDESLGIRDLFHSDEENNEAEHISENSDASIEGIQSNTDVDDDPDGMDADIEDNSTDEEDNNDRQDNHLELNHLSNIADNPRELPTVNEKITFWHPTAETVVTGTIKHMVKKLQAKYPGCRNILLNGDCREICVNLDLISPNCVAWRYCGRNADNNLITANEEEPQEAAAHHDDQLEDVVQQVDGVQLTPDSLSTEPVLAFTHNGNSSLEWDNYASEPSFLGNPIHPSKRKTKSSTRNSFIDEPCITTTSNDEDAFFTDEPPQIPPRARSRQSVIQCSSKTCKPKQFNNQ